MPEILQTIVRLLNDLGTLLVQLSQLLAAWMLLIAWLAWWLWGVNWKKAWPVLAQGAWTPAVLVMILGALAWSQMAPSECTCLKLVTIPNFWWQLGAVASLAAAALACGWLQGFFQWSPAEVSLEPPPAATHGHGHH